MAKRYTIYGNYGFTTQTTLHEDTDRAAAIRWAKDYASSEDAGGYDIIEVAWFADTGEYITEFTWSRSELEQPFVESSFSSDDSAYEVFA